MQPKRGRTFGDPFITEPATEWAIYVCAAALVILLMIMFLRWRRKRIGKNS